MRRGVHLTPKQALQARDRDLLPPRARAVYDEYEKLRPLEAGLRGCFVADVAQGPSQGHGVSGSFLHTLVTHGTIVSFAQNRIFTKKELMAAMGFHLFPQTNQSFDSGLAVGRLSSSAAHRMTGNSFMLPVFTAWLLYIFAHLDRACDVSKIGHHAPTCVVADSDGEA